LRHEIIHQRQRRQRNAERQEYRDAAKARHCFQVHTTLVSRLIQQLIALTEPAQQRRQRQ